MKQPTQSSRPIRHGGGNPIRIGGFLTISRMMCIKDDENGRSKVFFRQAHLLGSEFRDREVPYIQVSRTPDPDDANSAKFERYYFCRRYMVPATVYLPMLFKTKHLTDDKVDIGAAHEMSQEEARLEMQLTADDRKNSRWPYKTRMSLFEKCVRKYYEKHSFSEIARMLFVTEHEVRRCLNGKTQVLNDPTTLSQTRSRLKDAPEYRAIQEEVKAARVKARNSTPRITESFTASDALPTMYDIQGNSGSHNGDLVVPKVCPVLRIRLDYNVFENRNALNKIRVWRKTPGPDGAAPMDKDNVIIMSKAATRVLEGAQAVSVMNGLSDEARNALAEWQAKYGTRTVPREAKIGRPRKAV